MKTDLILSESDIKTRIYTIRDLQVMLDEDLAELYGVPTKVLNQAVKRNSERFPKEFMFQLTEKEYSSLRSQIATLEPKSNLKFQIGTSKAESNLRFQNGASSVHHDGRRCKTFQKPSEKVICSKSIRRNIKNEN